MVCCGDPMVKLEPKKSGADVDYEIHVSASDTLAIVAIGSQPGHPMTPAHYIEWVVLETKQGYQRKELAPMMDSMVTFALTPGDEVVAAYAYCNHCGLVKSD